MVFISTGMISSYSFPIYKVDKTIHVRIKKYLKDKLEIYQIFIKIIRYLFYYFYILYHIKTIYMTHFIAIMLVWMLLIPPFYMHTVLMLLYVSTINKCSIIIHCYYKLLLTHVSIVIVVELCVVVVAFRFKKCLNSMVFLNKRNDTLSKLFVSIKITRKNVLSKLRLFMCFYFLLTLIVINSQHNSCLTTIV